LSPEPWQAASENYSLGQIVEAVVTRLTDFGAFARIQGNIEGLIHISELAHQVIRHPNEVVSEGDTVSLKIINIEPERRRLGLSLKQAGGDFVEGGSWSFGE
jgi:small subunit ribosomal protein S1